MGPRPYPCFYSDHPRGSAAIVCAMQPIGATLKHILIVDDEEAVCWSLQRALSREGHSVAVAASAELAFSLIGQQRPYAIILDVRLPGIDGLSALAKFRQLAPGAAVIVVTAFGNLPTAVRAVEGGAFDYLPKPFDLSQAIECVNRALLRRPSSVAPDAAESAAGPAESRGRRTPRQNSFYNTGLRAAPH